MVLLKAPSAKKKHIITYIRCRISTCIYINIKLKKKIRRKKEIRTLMQ